MLKLPMSDFSSNNTQNNKLEAEPPRKFLQQELLENVSQEIELSWQYLVLLIFSTLIAVLGLLIDSAAVVIGAMLISPLFWPILGLTIGIITTKENLARRSTLNLILSVGIVLLIGFLLAEISPLSQVTREISSRTNPTLLDLFIALAASVVGVLAIYHPRISQSTSGVAISIALLPPLCVSGIGIAFGSLEVFLGSFLLFATNTGAIIFTGAITLYLLKFRPKKAEEKARLKFGLFVSLIFLTVLSIPLTYFLFQSIAQNRDSAIVNQQLIEHLTDISPEARVRDLAVKFPPRFSRGLVEIEATIYLPEDTVITNSTQSKLIEDLSERLDQDINLQLNLVNSLVLSREEDEQIRQKRLDIRQQVISEFSQTVTTFEFESIDIQLLNQENQTNAVNVVVKDSYADIITYEDKLTIEEHLADTFNEPFLVEVQFLPLRKLSQTSELNQLEEQLDSVVNDFLIENQIDGEVSAIQITQTNTDDVLSLLQATSSSTVLGIQSASAQITLYINQEQELDEDFGFQLQQYIDDYSTIPVVIQLRLLRYQTS